MANAKKRTTKRYGNYRAEVTGNVDPEAIGRVRVRLPAGIIASRAMREVWAPVATLFAGSQSGSWFMPNVGDQVLISFEAGDVRRPCVLGALWGQNARPPETMDETGQNLRRVLRSPNGVQIIFDDQPGQEQLLFETPGGPAVKLRCGPGRIEITDSNGNAIMLEAGGITLNSAAVVTISAGAAVELNASTLTVNGGMAKFSGVIQCETLIANSVVASSYTPGAGNIW